MAWIKKIPHPETGAIASYWDSVSVNWNKQTGMTVFTVGGWVNREAYQDGFKPLLTFTWEIPSGSNPELSEAADAFLSGFARDQEVFEGSHEV